MRNAGTPAEPGRPPTMSMRKVASATGASNSAANASDQHAGAAVPLRFRSATPAVPAQAASRPAMHASEAKMQVISLSANS